MNATLIGLLPLLIAGHATAQPAPTGAPSSPSAAGTADAPEPAVDAAARGAAEPPDVPLAPASDGVDEEWLDAAAERVGADPAPKGAAPPSHESEPDLLLQSEYPGMVSAEAATSESFVSHPGAQTSDRFLLPSGVVEAGGELVLMTSDYRLGTDRIGLTDVGLLRLRGRRTFGPHLGLFAALHLLAKQPQSVDEPVWQGALGGALTPFGRGFAAEVAGGGGPLLGRDGAHYELTSRLLYKRPIERYLRFELGLGAATTGLVLRPEPEAPFWFEEIVTHAQAQFGEEDEGGVWIGIDYRVPYARSPREPVWDGLAERAFDMGTTLGLSVGGVGQIEDTGWELFAILSVVDRGELDDASTELPILDGGFDQTQLSLGVQHRFSPPDPARRRERRLRRRGSPGGPLVLPVDSQ